MANKAVRIRMLERLARRNSRNPVLVMRLLEQIAKEVGDIYTNRRRNEMTGADGGPIETKEINIDHLSPDEMDLLEKVCLSNLAERKPAGEK